MVKYCFNTANIGLFPDLASFYFRNWHEFTSGFGKKRKKEKGKRKKGYKLPLCFSQRIMGKGEKKEKKG
jgi:hypothetical protein